MDKPSRALSSPLSAVSLLKLTSRNLHGAWPQLLHRALDMGRCRGQLAGIAEHTINSRSERGRSPTPLQAAHTGQCCVAARACSCTLLLPASSDTLAGVHEGVPQLT